MGKPTLLLCFSAVLLTVTTTLSEKPSEKTIPIPSMNEELLRYIDNAVKVQMRKYELRLNRLTRAKKMTLGASDRGKRDAEPDVNIKYTGLQREIDRLSFGHVFQKEQLIDIREHLKYLDKKITKASDTTRNQYSDVPNQHCQSVNMSADSVHTAISNLTEDLHTLNATVTSLTSSLNQTNQSLNSVSSNTTTAINNLTVSIDNLSGTQNAFKMKVSRCTYLIKKTQTGLNKNRDSISTMMENVDILNVTMKSIVSTVKYPQNNCSGFGDNLKRLSDIITAYSYDRTKILISDYNSGKIYYRRLINMSLRSYPPLSVKANEIDALAYDPINRVLVYSRRSPSGIYSSPLDGGKTTTLKTGIKSEGLAMDDWLGIVFYTTWEPRHTLSRMSISGGDHRVLIDFSENGDHGDKNPYGVAVDKDRQRVYVCKQDRMLSTTYNGDNIQTLYRGWLVYYVSLDSVRGHVYFSEYKVIWRSPLSGGSLEQVGEMESAISDMSYHDNIIYRADRGAVYIYDLYTKTTVKIGDYTYPRLCIIP